LRILILLGIDVPLSSINTEDITKTTGYPVYTNQQPPASEENAVWIQQGDKTPDYSWPDYSLKVGTIETGREKFDDEITKPPADLTAYILQSIDELDTEEHGDEQSDVEDGGP
jgi:hypothetical protein